MANNKGGLSTNLETFHNSVEGAACGGDIVELAANNGSTEHSTSITD
jgi:hypothetical protein